MSRQRKPEAPERGARLSALREQAGLSRTEFARLAGVTTRTVALWESGDGSPREWVFRELDRLTSEESYTIARRDNALFTFIDLFAGIGGMRLGFEAAGGQCVFTSEWDRYCQKTYRANFGNSHQIYEDITAAEPQYRVIPDHDVLVAGFPCQPFSIAGVSKKNALGRPHGFDCETQGTLFFNIERILELRKPKAFLLENVKNLQSHDKGKTYQVITRTLQRLGYTVQSRVMDARWFVPQHRERIFIVGFWEDTGFDLYKDVELPVPDEWPRLDTVLHREDGTEQREERFLDKRGKVLPKYVLTDHLWKYLRDYAVKHQAKGNGFGFGLVGPENIARTLSARYFKDGSEILVRRKRGNPRRLTPRECARLMGFDHGDRIFTIPADVSDTQLYRQFGNAVSPPLVEAVARGMVPFLTGKKMRHREVLELELV